MKKTFVHFAEEEVDRKPLRKTQSASDLRGLLWYQKKNGIGTTKGVSLPNLKAKKAENGKTKWNWKDERPYYRRKTLKMHQKKLGTKVGRQNGFSALLT